MENSDSKFYKEQPELFCGGGCIDKQETGGNVGEVFNIDSVKDFVEKIKSEIKAPYVSCSFSTLGGNENVSVSITLSMDKPDEWKNGIVNNSRYAKISLYKNGTVEKIAGSLPKLRRFKAKTQDAVIDKLNMYLNEPEKFEDGGNTDGEIQTKYYPASSDICISLDTHVPSSMANEQRRFNQNLKSFLLDKYGMTVEQYVAKKLHYKSVDDLCYGPETVDYSSPDWRNLLKDRKQIVRFAQEQIDAIATAIFNYEEKGDAIIIADQTGVGKGRQAAGLIRYAYLELNVIPFFFTEKKHLINDIYRDLIAIGFDAGIPQEFKKNVTSTKTEFTDEELVKIILKDIKDDGDVRVEYDFADNFEIEWLRNVHNEADKNYEQILTVMDELIELYRMKFTEEGYSKDSFEKNMNYAEQVLHAQTEGKIIVEPYFPNRGDIVDINGNILYGRMTDAEMKTILAYKKVGMKLEPDWEVSPSALNLPSKYKLFTIPYSQTKSPYSSKKAGKQFLKPGIKLYLKYANNSVVILDESHTASGGEPGKPSNTFFILSQIIKSSAMTTYLSATYAKRASNMPLYAMKTSMRESGLSDVEMIMAFLEGETALQEAVSVELTRNGQLLRREKKIEGKSEYYYAKDEESDPVGVQQRLRMNKVADLFSKIRDFQVSVHDIVKEYKEDLPTRAENGDKLEGSKDEINKSRTIKALTFQMFNFFLLGLKVQQTVGFSLDKLNSGKKTVITVANTMESALNNMSKTFLSDGKDDTDKYRVGDEIENDFKLYIAYLLNYTLRWNRVVEQVESDGTKTEVEKTIFVLGDKHPLSEEIRDALLVRYKALLTEILDTTTGVSIAPIDEIKRKIKDAGYSVNEITGRQLCVEFSGNDFSKGVIAKRDIKPTTTLVREFNENKIDCLLINQSGAVGISMHAVPNAIAHKVYEPTTVVDENGKEVTIENAPLTLKDKSEVKKRAMIITQMELDISKEVQKLGRINRTGQVYQPEFFYIISAIPSEARLTALMERKLRSLSANVSAEQTQSSYMFTSDDFYSTVAIEPFNETMKDLNQRDRAGKDNPNDIKEYTKGLYFSDFDFQKNFYETFSKRLNAEIIRLTAQGLYNGKMSSKDYKAELVNKYPFFIGDENARTSFGRHGFIEESIVTQYRSKNIDKQIAQAIDERLYLKLTDYASDSTENDGEDHKKKSDLRFFSSIPLFQAEANRALDAQHLAKQKTQLETVKKVNDDIAESEAELAVERKKLVGFGSLLEAIEIEKQMDENAEKIREINNKITECATSGDTDGLIKYGTEMAPLKQTQVGLLKKMESFGDISEEKTKHRLTTRAIKAIESDIERAKTKIVSYTQAMQEWNELNATCKDYVNRIGSVVMYSELKETKHYENETGELQVDVQKVSYQEVVSEPCVITGVTFPYDGDDLTPSSFDVYFTFVSRKDKLPLSKLHKKIREEQKALGYKNTISLTNFAPNYKDVWNDIAGKQDNSYKETKWFIAGTLLKTFIMSKQNGLNGTITKYTTSDNKGRIGIEITNKIDPNNPTKGTYTSLEERYSVNNSLQYPVYFDGNPNNVNNLITKYVYWFMFGKLYDLHKNSTEVDKWEHRLQRSNGGIEFLFQISSQIGFSGVIIKPSSYLIEEFDKTLDIVTSEKRIKHLEEIDFDTFCSNLTVELITTSINYSDGFAMLLQQQGVNINSENYKPGNKSNLFPNIENDGRKKQYYIGNGLLFKQIFPTNVVDLQSGRNSSIEWTNRVIMTFDEFILIIKDLDARKSRPSFAIGSEFFSKASSMYVLEQFIDEMEVAQVQGEEVTFDSSIEGELEKMLDSKIDELVKLLA